MTATETVPEAVREAWEAAVARWEDPAAHDAVLAAAAQHGSFGWACARYRERGDDPIATERLARLQRAALATMYATRAARPDAEAKPFRATLALLAILVIALGLGLVAVAVLHGHHPPAPTARGR